MMAWLAYICFCFLTFVVGGLPGLAARGVGGATVSFRDLQRGDGGVSFRVLQASSSVGVSSSAPPSQLPELTVLADSLVVDRSAVVVVHPNFQPPDRVDEKGTWCGSSINDIAVSSRDPNLYYVLDESCEGPAGGGDMILSIWKANVGALVAEENRPIFADRKVISYWWPYSMHAGERFSKPINAREGVNGTPIIMAGFSGLDISGDGEHIVLFTYPVGGSRGSSVASVYSVSGLRRSVSVLVDKPQGVCMDASKTRLYVPDRASPLQILAMAVDMSGLPIHDNSRGDILTKSGDNVSYAQFTSQSVNLAGTCIYFTDLDNRVMGFDPLTSTITHVAGSGEAGDSDHGDGRTVSFRAPRRVATTPDGCNVFVTENKYPGTVRWLKLDSPCTLARRVETVARFGSAETGFVAIALHDYGNRSYLYVGTTTGLVFRMQIDSSRLHECRSGVPFAPASFSPSQPRSADGIRIPVVIIVIVVVVVLTMSIAFGFRWLWRTRRHRAQEEEKVLYAGTPSSKWAGSSDGRSRGGGGGRSSSSSKGELNGGGGGGGDPLEQKSVKRFDLATLRESTGNFDARNRIGEKGGFGDVYRAVVDGREVAVKVMTGHLTDAKRKQFLAEVRTLSGINHVNLIELIGFCQEGDMSMLVYPFYPGGSLYARLHQSGSGRPESPLAADAADKRRLQVPPPPRPLTLEERMLIAFQIAQGLSYLHGNLRQPIVHRDVKSCNVLLGEGQGKNKQQAVLCDFGLATIGERVFETHHDLIVMTSHVGGTFGYMAPEYLLRGELSEKNDVYAFGMVVLELLTGRKVAVQSASGVGWETVRQWVQPFLGIEEGGGKPRPQPQPRPQPEPGTRMDMPHTILDPCLRDQVEPEPGTRMDMPHAILDPCLRDQVVGPLATGMVMDTLRLAWDCAQMEDIDRPAMRVIVHRMQDILEKAGILT